MADLRIRVLLTSKDAGFAKIFRGSADDVRALTKELRSMQRVMAKLGGSAPIAHPFREAAAAIRDTATETERLNKELKEAAKTGKRVRIGPDSVAGAGVGPGAGVGGDPYRPRPRKPRVAPTLSTNERFASIGDDVFRDASRAPRPRRPRDPGEEQDRWGARLHHTGLALERGAARTRSVLASILGPTEDYERAMVNTLAVTDDANKAFDSTQSNADALRAASMSFTQFGYGATQTTKALEFMALAGFSTKQQLAAIPHVLDAARAGSEDLEKSASLLTDTMTAFGKKADDMQQVADVMTYVNNKTNTTLSLTARAMFEIGPYAVDAGLSMESMAAAVGVLAEAGIKGSKAGTAVRNMLLFLSKPAKPAREEIDKLGLSFKELNGYIARNDLSGAIVRIDDAMNAKNYDDADRRRVYGTVFGSYTAGKASIIAQAARSGKFEEFEAGALASTGATADVAAKKLKSDPGRIDVMRAKFEEAKLTLGQKVLPELLPIGEGLLELATDFAKFAKQNPEFVKSATKALLAITAFGTVMGPVLTTFGSLTRAGALLQTALGAAQGAAGGTGVAGGLASMTWQSFKAADKVSKLGVALGATGLLGSVLAVSVGIGVAADNLFGISDKLAGIRAPGQGTDEKGYKLAKKRGVARLNKEELDELKKAERVKQMAEGQYQAWERGELDGDEMKIRGTRADARARYEAVKHKVTASAEKRQKDLEEKLPATLGSYMQELDAMGAHEGSLRQRAIRERKRGNVSGSFALLAEADKVKQRFSDIDRVVQEKVDRAGMLNTTPGDPKKGTFAKTEHWRGLLVRVEKDGSATISVDGREIRDGDGVTFPEGG